MRRPDGFTLIEIMVALVIGGLTLTTIVRVIVLLLAAAHDLASSSVDHEARMTAHHRIRAVLASIQQPTDAKWFRGTPHEATFSTALRVAADANEVAYVRLAVRGGRLTAVTSEGLEYVLATADSVAFEYLAGYGLSSPFLAAWTSSSESPVAIRVRLAQHDLHGAATIDTLLIPVRLDQ